MKIEPYSQTPPRFAPPLTITQLNVMIAMLAVTISWARVAQLVLPANWQGDFQYFWQAGRSWLSGQSVYGAGYLESGAVYFNNFANPFFYPPNVPPLLAPLAVLPPPEAAALLFCLSVCATFLIAALISRLAKQFGAHLPQAYIFIILIAFLSIYMRPVIRVAVFGQPTLLLALGFCIFLFGQARERAIWIFLGLVLLLVKPHFGAPVAIYALIRPESRRPALAAFIATAGLATAGLLAGSPAENINSFLANLSVYAAFPENGAAKVGGVTALSSYFAVPIPLIIKLALATAVAGALALTARTPQGVYAGACAALAQTFLIFPNHSTDFVLFAPAAIFAFLPAPHVLRVLVIASFLLLGRSWDIARLITPVGSDHAPVVGFIHTGVFAAFFVAFAVFLLLPKSISMKYKTAIG